MSTRWSRWVSVAAIVGASGLFAGGVRAEDATGVKFEATDVAWTDVLARAKESGKAVFVDFSTEWCGWCRRLEADTYSKPEVAAKLSAFYTVMYDANKPEGRAVAAKFNVHGYPTLVVADAAGEEIDRIVGYLAPTPFLKEVDRIERGDGTLKSLRERRRAQPDDAQAGLALAEKLLEIDPKGSASVLTEVAALKSADPQVTARLGLLTARVALETGDLAAALPLLEAVAREHGKTDAGLDAALLASSFLQRTDPEKGLELLAAAGATGADARGGASAAQAAAALHVAAAARALERQGKAAGDDPQALNEAAWECFLRGVNTEVAIQWARRAVELSKRDAMIVDTLANLLFVKGEVAEAVTLETEALAKVPEPQKADFAAALAKFKAVQALEKAPAGALRARAADDDDDDEEGDDDDDEEEEDDDD